MISLAPGSWQFQNKMGFCNPRGSQHHHQLTINAIPTKLWHILLLSTLVVSPNVHFLPLPSSGIIGGKYYSLPNCKNYLMSLLPNPIVSYFLFYYYGPPPFTSNSFNVLNCNDGFSKSIWQTKAFLRVAFFAWPADLGKILIMDNLRKWYVIVIDRCFICKRNVESVDHLLLYCEVVCALWIIIFFRSL